MHYGDIRDTLQAIINILRGIEKDTHCQVCGGSAVTSAAVEESVPEGFKSIAIVKTSEAGTVNIEMSDGSTYPMTVQGEVFVQSGTGLGRLPAYEITGDGTWKWHGVK